MGVAARMRSMSSASEPLPKRHEWRRLIRTIHSLLRDALATVDQVEQALEAGVGADYQYRQKDRGVGRGSAAHVRSIDSDIPRRGRCDNGVTIHVCQG